MIVCQERDDIGASLSMPGRLELVDPSRRSKGDSGRISSGKWLLTE